MKKLLLSSIILLLFSCSILLFQVSCQKEANAQTNSNGIIQSNKILYAVGYQGGPGVVNSAAKEYWIMNYDGTNATKIPLTFDSNFSYTMYPKISPDGKTIFFSASSSYKAYLYSCSVDGTNLRTLTIKDQNAGSGANIEIGNAY